MKKVITCFTVLSLLIMSLLFVPHLYAIDNTSGLHISNGGSWGLSEDFYYVAYQGDINIPEYVWGEGFIVDVANSYPEAVTATWEVFEVPSSRPIMNLTGRILDVSQGLLTTSTWDLARGYSIKIRVSNIKTEDGGQIDDPIDYTNKAWVEEIDNRAYVNARFGVTHMVGQWNGTSYHGDLVIGLLESDENHWFSFWTADQKYSDELNTSTAQGTYIQNFKVTNPDPSIYKNFFVYLDDGLEQQLVFTANNIDEFYFSPEYVPHSSLYRFNTDRILFTRKTVGNVTGNTWLVDLKDYILESSLNEGVQVKILVYWERILTPSDFTEDDWILVNNISQLPSTIGTLSDAKDSSKIGDVFFNVNPNNSNEVRIIVNSTPFKMVLSSLPGVAELGKQPLSTGVYYTENGKKFIYYEFQRDDEDDNLIAFRQNEGTKKFRPFAEINLTDGTYNFTNNIILYAVHHDGGQGKAFVDVLFPFDLDSLLSISIQYKSRFEQLWGAFYTPWEETIITRYIEESVDMKTTWQHFSDYLYLGVVFPTFEVLNGWSFGDTITEVTNLDQSYKNRYVERINAAELLRGNPSLSMSQIFKDELSMYRIYLNTFNEAFTTGYQIHDDITVMEAVYVYNGIVYQIDYPELETISVGGENEDDPVDDLVDKFQQLVTWVNNNWVLMIIIVVIIIFLVFGLPVIASVKTSLSKITASSKPQYKSKYSTGRSGMLLILFLIGLAALIVFIGFTFGWW